jgi:hypothetical protein
MGLRGVDESLFPIITPMRLLGEVLGDCSKTKGLIGIGIFLDDRKTNYG